MRLTLGFSCTPSPPPRRDVADDGLSALVHGEVLDRHLLLATSAVTLERLDLGDKGPRELVEGPFRTVLLLACDWPDAVSEIRPAASPMARK